MRARYLVLALCLLSILVVVVPLIFVVVLSVARPPGQQPSVARAGVAVDRLPPLARSMLPLVNDRISKNCPELDAVRVLAEVQAESGWNPRAWSEDVNGGAAGLLQINQANWVGLGGRPWLAVPPTPDADINDPSVHLTLGIDFLCANLRAMTAHLKQTGKTIDPMDAMSVCHIAGCGRVTGSSTGIPQAGEASCGTRCAELVSRYLNNIHRYEQDWTATPAIQGPAGTLPPGVDVGALAAPNPYTGGPTGCSVPDPTTAGCVTAATANGISELRRIFGGQVRSAGCFAARPGTPPATILGAGDATSSPTARAPFPQGSHSPQGGGSPRGYACTARRCG